MLRVATYNTHDCVGRDRRYSPTRIAHIVSAMEADVVALQEVTLDHAGDVLAKLEDITGMRAIDGTLFSRGVGRYGNVLLTRHPVVEQRLHDLSFADREPRGVLDAVVRIGDRQCRLLTTHLGLRRAERAAQIQRLTALLEGESAPTVILGDFNVWSGPKAFAPLRDAGFEHCSVPSYPTWLRPTLALDRVFVRAPAIAHGCWRFDRPPASIASDHYPVIVELEFGADASHGRPAHEGAA